MAYTALRRQAERSFEVFTAPPCVRPPLWRNLIESEIGVVVSVCVGWHQGTWSWLLTFARPIWLRVGFERGVVKFRVEHK